MRKSLLITTAVLTASLAASAAGLGTASASTASASTGNIDQICVQGYNTCLNYPYTKYKIPDKPYFVIPINDADNAQLQTSYNWPAKNHVASGAYYGPVNGVQESVRVTDVTLGGLTNTGQCTGNVCGGGYYYDWTCVKFTVPATETSAATTIELYNKPKPTGNVWYIEPKDTYCMK